jgi:hypothetical protein
MHPTGTGVQPDNQSEMSDMARERNRRRSSRRDIKMFVRVYGHSTNGAAFYENARTINVSVHGALLQLSAPVTKGQKLLLFNEVTQRQQVCQIVDVCDGDTESHVVAVAFPVPHAEFWHASSPANPRDSVAQ